MNQKSLWTIIIIVLVVFLLIFAFTRFQASRDTDSGSTEPADENAISVSEQDPEQLGASFERVDLVNPGFIVVRGVANGNAGIIVGVSPLLSAGEHKNVQVLMELVPEQEYEAQLYQDNGNGVFDEGTDTPMLTAGGSVASARFNVAQSEDFIGK